MRVSIRPVRANPASAAALLVIGAVLYLPAANAQVAVDDTFTVEPASENNPLDVIANDNLDGGSSFIWTVSEPNQGGDVRIVSSRRLLEYTPDNDFEGVETFTYSLLSGGFRFSTAQVTVFVSGANSVPIARNDEYSTSEDTVLDIGRRDGVLANDEDPDNDDLRATLLDGPSNGTMSLQSNSGAFTYRPSPGFSGEDSFRYLADDGNNSSEPAVVTITVRPLNLPPVIDDIPDQNATVGVLFELLLSDFVTDTDTPGTSLRYEAVAMPTGLTLSADGLVAGYPAPETAGQRLARFEVDDGSNTVAGQFRIRVSDERITDLSVTLTATPNPALIGTRPTWSIAVTNRSNYAVDTARVEGQITGESPFLVDMFDYPGCMLLSMAVNSEFACNLTRLDIGETTTIGFTGTSNDAGDVLGIVTVVASDSPENDFEPATTTLSIADEISEQPAQWLTGFQALALASGDLDGDGHEDLAVATEGSESLLVFLNVPDPANERKRRLSSTPIRLGADVRDSDLALGDLDGDSDLDIVAAGSESTFPRVFLNDGSAAFQAITLDQVAHDASAIAIADIDADGFADLAISGAAQNLVYFGAGVPGLFADPVSVGSTASADVALADLLGTGRAQLIFANADQDVSIYSYEGSAFQLRSGLATGATTSVAGDDFNGDGKIDLLFGRSLVDAPADWPSNPLYLNESTTELRFALADGLGAAPTSKVITAGANANAVADAVVLNSTGAHQIFFGSGAGFSLAARQLSVTGAGDAAVGNFSVDGRRDLAIGGSMGVKVFLSDSTGNFGLGDTTAPAISMIGASTVEVAVGDNYLDAGATALDADDGDLTDQIAVSSTVNTSLIGTYVVTYQVWDTSGNAAPPVTRSVSVAPRTPTGGGGGGVIDLATLSALLSFWLAMAVTHRRRQSRYQALLRFAQPKYNAASAITKTK